MSTNQLLKLTLLAGIDVGAMAGALVGASNEPATSAAAPAPATQKKPAATGKTPLTARDVWGNDYGRAWKQAKQLNRPVLLHFHAVWCGPCQQMEREVLNTPAVLHELNACCVAVKIDCDQQPVLVQQFGVESLPCDVLVTPDLKMHRVNQGFVPADRYPSLISQAVKQKTEARIQVSAK